MATTIKQEEALAGLEGGPVVRMRADELAPFGWAPAMVMVAVALVDRIETNIVAGVLPSLQAEWGFSDTWGGAIPTAAAIAGVIVSLPAGYLADRTHRTRLIAIVVATWSVITLGSALALTFSMFFLTRIVLGAADSIDNPSSSSLLADYYPPRARARAYGYQRMAYYAGGALGVLLGGVVAEIAGWRWAFGLMVVPGLAVAGLCWILREPVRGAIDRFVAAQQGEISKAEAAEAASEWVGASEGERGEAAGTGVGALMRQLLRLLKVRTVFFVYFGVTTLSFGLAGIFFWLPSFYERTRGLGEGAAGGLTALVQLVGIIGGAYAGGMIGDRLHRARPGGRILLGGGGLVVGAVLLAGSFDTPTLALQVLVLTAAVFCMALAIPNLTAAVADVLPADQRGVGFALFTFLTTLGGALGPFAVGVVSDMTTLKTAFYVLTVPALVGALVVLAGRTTFEGDAERVLEEARRG